MTEHATFNDLIRTAAGRVDTPVDVSTGDDRAATNVGAFAKPGSIGIGRGGTAAVRPKAARTNAEINRRIRRGARVVRDVQLRDGVEVDLNLDDPWGH
jgi:hypothetical protein